MTQDQSASRNSEGLSERLLSHADRVQWNTTTFDDVAADLRLASTLLAKAPVSEQQPINKLPRDSMVIDPLPAMVMEAIDAYGRYYAEQHKLGMSVRDDMKYIASVAIRSVTGGDGGLDIAQELRSVLAWEEKRMGRVSAGVLKSVIKRLEDLLPASAQNQSNERPD